MLKFSCNLCKHKDNVPMPQQKVTGSRFWRVLKQVKEKLLDNRLSVLPCDMKDCNLKFYIVLSKNKYKGLLQIKKIHLV